MIDKLALHALAINGFNHFAATASEAPLPNPHTLEQALEIWIEVMLSLPQHKYAGSKWAKVTEPVHMGTSINSEFAHPLARVGESLFNG